MQPRTLAIVVVVLVGGAIGLRLLVVHFGLLPVSEEAVLKKATAITVTYYNGEKVKSLRISDRDQLREALAALRIHEDRHGHYYGGFAIGMGMGVVPQTGVTFHFPNGTRREHLFSGGGGYQNLELNGQFCEKLSEIISRHEGKRVDVLSAPPRLMEWNNNPGGQEQIDR
jgi:hypothetical protein